MDDKLAEKTAKYERLLAEACASVEATPADPDEPDPAICLEMARSYLEDGRHFAESDDLPNALASYSYGHGWLDAGLRLGVLQTTAE